MSGPGQIELALSASSADVTVAARIGTRLETESAKPGRGGPDAAQLASRVVARLGAAPPAIAHLVVDRGPGSYTGLRGALTFARTIAAFRGATLSTLTSVELLAYAAWRSGDVASDREVLVILDARRGHHHIARLSMRNWGVQLIDGPRAVRSDDVIALVDGSADIAADETTRARFASWCTDRSVALCGLRPIDAAAMFDTALAPIGIAPELLEPLYLLPSYAEGESGGT